jgi:hypothetical protein
MDWLDGHYSLTAADRRLYPGGRSIPLVYFIRKPPPAAADAVRRRMNQLTRFQMQQRRKALKTYR